MDDTAPTPASSTATMTSTPIVGQLLETSATTVKPGWQTTEFYFALAAKILSGLFAFGLVGDGSTLSRLAGVAGFVLTQMGYTVSRTLIKTAAMVAVVIFAFHSTGCGASTRLKTLGGTMATLDAVEITLQTYDTQHLAAIAADPKNDSRAKIDAATAKWLADYAAAHKLIANAANLIAAGYKLDDEPSLAAAETAAAQVMTFLTGLGVKL